MRKDLSLSPVGWRVFWSGIALVAAVLLLFVACNGGMASTTLPLQPGQTSAQAANQVNIVGQNGRYAFDPATLTVKKGTQVVWTNTSDASHTVTSDTGVFQSPGTLATNQTYQFTFATAGTFTYHCDIHPYMTGTIVVTE